MVACSKEGREQQEQCKEGHYTETMQQRGKIIQLRDTSSGKTRQHQCTVAGRSTVGWAFKLVVFQQQVCTDIKQNCLLVLEGVADAHNVGWLLVWTSGRRHVAYVLQSCRHKNTRDMLT
jgi:tRNA G18 (ribose-2'-O)-methylase SpoU